MEKLNPYPIDSHIIDYFLSIAEKMESQLNEEAYAYVQRIFTNTESEETFENLPLDEGNIQSLSKKQNTKNLTQKV